MQASKRQGAGPKTTKNAECKQVNHLSETPHSGHLQGRVVQIYDSLKRPSSSRLSSPPISNVTCRDYYGPPGSSHYTRPSGTSRYLGRYDTGARSSWTTSSTTSPNASRESSLAPAVNGVASRCKAGDRDSSLRSVSPSYRANPLASSSSSSINGRPSVSSAVLDYSYRRNRDIADMKRDYSTPYGQSSITTSSKYVATSSIRPTSPNFVGSYSSRSTPVSPRASRTVSPTRATPSSSTDYYSCRPTSSYLYTKSYDGYGNPSSSSDIYYSLPRPTKRRTTYTSSSYGSPSYTPLSSTTPTRNFQYSSPVASRELSPVSNISPTPSVSAGIISGYRRLTGKTSPASKESTDYEVGNSEHLSRNAWSRLGTESPASTSPMPTGASSAADSEDASKSLRGSYYLSRSSARYGAQSDVRKDETVKKALRPLSIGNPDHDHENAAETIVNPMSEITSVKLDGTMSVPNKGLIPLNHFATPEYLSGQQDSPVPEDQGAFLLKADEVKSEPQVEPKVDSSPEENELIPFQGIQERLKARRSSQIADEVNDIPEEPIKIRAPKLLSPTMSADSGVHSEAMSPPISRKTSQNGHETGNITPTEACDKLFASQAKIEELQGSLPRSYKNKRPKRPKAVELQNASADELEAMLKGLKGKSPLERIHDFSHSNSDLSCLSLANSLAESQKEIYLSRQKKQEAKELFFFPKSRPFKSDPVITRETNELLQRQDVILEGLKLETEELQAQIRQLEDQLDDTQSQVIDDLQCQIRDLAQRLANTQTNCQHLEGTNANLKSEIQNLENELLEAQDHFNEKDYKEWKRLRKDLGAMAKSCRNFQLKLRRSQMKSNELRVVNKELSSNVAHQEQTIHLFRTGILWGSVLLLGYHVWNRWR
eukprot:TCALIF_11706-PA protein Name:"Protein of unknown function" AED:0.03 eAED:0.03 QI:0/1/0.88/1/1/1/9/75/882